MNKTFLQFLEFKHAKKYQDKIPDFTIDFDIWFSTLQSFEFIKYADEYVEEVKKEIKEKLERIKLDMDVVVCDCGEPYKDSDPADLINELLKDL